MSLRVKEFLVVVCLVAFVIYISRQNSYTDVDTTKIMDNIIQSTDMGDMEKFGNTEFKKSFGVNANDYDGIAYYGHQSVMNSETILVIRLKSEDQGENIIDIINTLKETNMELFKSYAADQYKLLSESILEQKGKYVLYVVSDDAASIEKAFTKSITE